MVRWRAFEFNFDLIFFLDPVAATRLLKCFVAIATILTPLRGSSAVCCRCYQMEAPTEMMKFPVFFYQRIAPMKLLGALRFTSTRQLLPCQACFPLYCQ